MTISGPVDAERAFKIDETKIYRKEFLLLDGGDEKSLFSEIERVRKQYLHAKMDRFFSKPKNICLVNTVKNEASYLLEWIAYHQEIGVDGFVILDNGSTDETPQLLQKLDDAGVICSSPWPNAHQHEKQQIAAYVAVMDRLQSQGYCAWVGLMDPDEFIALPNHDTVLEALPDCDAVFIHWSFFGSSGKTEREEGLVTERFLKRAPLHHWRNRSGKFLARVSKISGHYHHMHDIFISDMTRFKHADGTPYEGHPHVLSDWPEQTVIESRQNCMSLHHYAVKSHQEFIEKIAKGRGNYRPDEKKISIGEEYFKGHDFNQVEDTHMLKFKDRIEHRLRVLEDMIG